MSTINAPEEGRNGVFFSGIYPFPPTSSSRTALRSQPYPADMPFRTLHRSSSPQKNVACALDFLRYGFTEKRNVLIQYRRIVIARQAAVCCGNPFPNRAQSIDNSWRIIYLYPPSTPFKVSSPYGEDAGGRMNIRRMRIAQMMKNQSVDSTSRFSVRKSFIEGRWAGLDK